MPPRKEGNVLASGKSLSRRNRNLLFSLSLLHSTGSFHFVWVVVVVDKDDDEPYGAAPPVAVGRSSYRSSCASFLLEHLSSSLLSVSLPSFELE